MSTSGTFGFNSSNKSSTTNNGNSNGGNGSAFSSGTSTLFGSNSTPSSTHSLFTTNTSQTTAPSLTATVPSFTNSSSSTLKFPSDKSSSTAEPASSFPSFGPSAEKSTTGTFTGFASKQFEFGSDKSFKLDSTTSGSSLFGNTASTIGTTSNSPGISTPASSKKLEFSWSTTPSGPPPSTNSGLFSNSTATSDAFSTGSAFSSLGVPKTSTSTLAGDASKAPTISFGSSSNTGFSLGDGKSAITTTTNTPSTLTSTTFGTGLANSSGSETVPATTATSTTPASTTAAATTFGGILATTSTSNPSTAASTLASTLNPTKNGTFSFSAKTSGNGLFSMASVAGPTPAISSSGTFNLGTNSSTPNKSLGSGGPSFNFGTTVDTSGAGLFQAAKATSALPGAGNSAATPSKSPLFSGLAGTNATSSSATSNTSLTSTAAVGQATTVTKGGIATGASTNQDSGVKINTSVNTSNDGSLKGANSASEGVTDSNDNRAGNVGQKDTLSASTLGGSISGPKPDPASALKNKSLDDIITRWATDLTKYQSIFQAQADQIVAWDRLLVENSNKISALYSHAFKAERDAAEIERQLTSVETQQDDLEVYLAKYEREVDELVQKSGVLGADGLRLSGVDREREQTYKLAEKLTEKINGLNRDVTEVVQEINMISASLSRTGNPDDPLSQVVRVLNSHLLQLQEIDSGTMELRKKVEAAQRDNGARLSMAASLDRNGRRSDFSVSANDMTEDFYKSFLARR